jgi:hypothetical protein
LPPRTIEQVRDSGGRIVDNGICLANDVAIIVTRASGGVEQRRRLSRERPPSRAIEHGSGQSSGLAASSTEHSTGMEKRTARIRVNQPTRVNQRTPLLAAK